jgi:hypothetical protein
VLIAITLRQKDFHRFPNQVVSAVAKQGLHLGVDPDDQSICINYDNGIGR